MLVTAMGGVFCTKQTRTDRPEHRVDPNRLDVRWRAAVSLRHARPVPHQDVRRKCAHHSNFAPTEIALVAVKTQDAS
jgi:hypothetical protein